MRQIISFLPTYVLICLLHNVCSFQITYICTMYIHRYIHTIGKRFVFYETGLKTLFYTYEMIPKHYINIKCDYEYLYSNKVIFDQVHFSYFISDSTHFGNFIFKWRFSKNETHIWSHRGKSIEFLIFLHKVY